MNICEGIFHIVEYFFDGRGFSHVFGVFHVNSCVEGLMLFFLIFVSLLIEIIDLVNLDWSYSCQIPNKWS